MKRDMPRLRLAQPLWLDHPPRAPVLPTLDRTRHVDVAVIGGGITGVSTAWAFADAGLRVGLVDCARIGRGSTSASTALLMQEPDCDFVELARRYGLRRARRIWQMSRAATRRLIRTLRELDIRCALSECDSIYYTTRADSARRLRAEYLRRAAAGLRCAWLDEGALGRATGIAGDGAIRTAGNGQVDPYRACLGLARAARRRGALLFERSPVERIESRSASVSVVTRRGRLEADYVVIATGYTTPFLKPLTVNFRLLNTYVVATRRLTARERRAIGLGDVMLWDTAHPYHYARWTADHRLVFGGGDRPHVAGRRRVGALRESVADLRRHFERLLPPVAGIETDFAWEGLFATTPDGLPYIGAHDGYPRHLFALGYGGNGMTFGFLAARLLLDWYRGGPSSDHRLFAFDRRRVSAGDP
jgi:glycine/D-amino acid oxidase-like deaminating enzyme